MSKRTMIGIAVVLGFVAIGFLICQLTSGWLGSSVQLRQLDANMQKWESQNIAHYQMKVGIGCFCPFYERMPLTVEVLNRKVLSVIDSQGRLVTEDDPVRLYDNQRLMTVEGVFGYAREAIQTADEARVEYDPLLGFPARLSIDRIELAMDDELSVVVSDLHVLP